MQLRARGKAHRKAVHGEGGEQRNTEHVNRDRPVTRTGPCMRKTRARSEPGSQRKSILRMHCDRKKGQKLTQSGLGNGRRGFFLYYCAARFLAHNQREVLSSMEDINEGRKARKDDVGLNPHAVKKRPVLHKERGRER